MNKKESFKLDVKCLTWDKENYELFDNESKTFKK
jgi:hypothetical protein